MFKISMVLKNLVPFVCVFFSEWSGRGRTVTESSDPLNRGMRRIHSILLKKKILWINTEGPEMTRGLGMVLFLQPVHSYDIQQNSSRELS